MFHLSFGAPRRTTTRRLTAVGGIAVVTLATVAGSLVLASTANAGVSSRVTITAVSPHTVPASTAKQVITVTGTGFSEDVISKVAVLQCGAADSAVNYIVVSPTTMVIKTADDCGNGTGSVTVTDSDSNTAVSSATLAAQALAFVAPPNIATASDTVRPVVTSNTTALAYDDQTTSASTKGGTVIRVTAGSVPFATSTAYPLAVTLGGVALTGVAVTGTGAGNFLTGAVGAHAADAAPLLKITNGGVSQTFSYGAGGTDAVDQTFDFTYAGSSITISPTSGPSNGDTVLTITGAGFNTTTGTNTVTLGAVSCPLVSAFTPTATTLKCTVPEAATALVGPVTVKVVVSGGLTSVIGAGSTYTYLAQ